VFQHFQGVSIIFLDDHAPMMVNSKEGSKLLLTVF